MEFWSTRIVHVCIARKRRNELPVTPLNWKRKRNPPFHHLVRRSSFTDRKVVACITYIESDDLISVEAGTRWQVIIRYLHASDLLNRSVIRLRTNIVQNNTQARIKCNFKVTSCTLFIHELNKSSGKCFLKSDTVAVGSAPMFYFPAANAIYGKETKYLLLYRPV